MSRESPDSQPCCKSHPNSPSPLDLGRKNLPQKSPALTEQWVFETRRTCCLDTQPEFALKTSRRHRKEPSQKSALPTRRSAERDSRRTTLGLAKGRWQHGPADPIESQPRWTVPFHYQRSPPFRREKSGRCRSWRRS